MSVTTLWHYLLIFWGGCIWCFNGLNVHWHKLTLTALRGYLGLYCLITNRLSILRIFFNFDYKYRGIITGRCTSRVASRGPAGVFCHHWPLTAGVSRVARAPALIPLCARLRTAVPETEGLNFAKRALRARAVLRGGGTGAEGSVPYISQSCKWDAVTWLIGIA